MARVTYVKKAQARFKTVPVLDNDGDQKVIPVMRKDGSPKKAKSGREITRRLTVDDPSQPLPNRKCEKCSVEIKVGDPYKWVKPKSGPYGGSKRVRCMACPSWRPSELTSSNALGILYAAQEAFGDAVSGWDREDIGGLEEALDDLASGVREAGEAYIESADNMESGFGTATSVSDEIREKGETLTGAADDIENAKDDLEAFDEDAVRAEVEDEVLPDYLAELGWETTSLSYEDAMAREVEDDSDEEAFDDEAYQAKVEEAIQEKRDEWADEQVSQAESAAENADAI